jgi:hypothetical protein
MSPQQWHIRCPDGKIRSGRHSKEMAEILASSFESIAHDDDTWGVDGHCPGGEGHTVIPANVVEDESEDWKDDGCGAS